MNKSYFSKTALLGFVALFFPPQGAVAETASCLSSYSTVGCTEPAVTAGTTETIKPAFPDASPACKKVTNSCAFNFAVPVASQEEWTSFLHSAFVNTTGSCASVKDCEEDSNGTCAPISALYNMGNGWLNGSTNRWGCTSPLPATNKVTGGKSWSDVLHYTNLTTWNCPGGGGGSTASCSCREGGGYKITVRFVNITLIWCLPASP